MNRAGNNAQPILQPPVFLAPGAIIAQDGEAGEQIVAGAPDAAGIAVAAAAHAPLPAIAPEPPAAAAAQVEQEQGGANPRGAAIAAIAVQAEKAPPVAPGGAGFLGFLQRGLGIASGYAGQAYGWLTAKQEVTIERILRTNPKYRPSPAVMRILHSNNARNAPFKNVAIKAKTAGEELTAAAKQLLQSLLLYRGAYAADGTTNGRALLVFTNRLFEDILLYLVADYKKSVAKTNLQEVIAPEASGNSNVEGEGYLLPFSVQLIPYQVRDVLNEILRANAEKAAQYMIEAGRGVREHAGMPQLLLRGNAGAAAAAANANNNVVLPNNNVARFDAQFLPAVKLAQKILNTRAARIERLLGSGVAAVAPGRPLGQIALAGPQVTNIRAAPPRNMRGLFGNSGAAPATAAGNAVAGLIGLAQGAVEGLGEGVGAAAAGLGMVPDEELNNNGLAAQPARKRARPTNLSGGRRKRQTQKKAKKAKKTRKQRNRK